MSVCVVVITASQFGFYCRRWKTDELDEQFNKLKLVNTTALIPVTQNSTKFSSWENYNCWHILINLIYTNVMVLLLTGNPGMNRNYGRWFTVLHVTSVCNYGSAKHSVYFPF